MTTQNTAPTFVVGDGVVTNSTFHGQSLMLQTDEKIIVAGYRANSAWGGMGDFALARYNSNGSLDKTFDTDGMVTMVIGLYSHGEHRVTLQTDGKILLSGYVFTGANGDVLNLTRYNSNGSLDTTFGTEGILTAKVIDGQSVAFQEDGKILLGGFSLTRYNSNGSLDPTFDTNNIVTSKIGTGSYGQSVTIQADGKILIAGINSTNSFVLVRYNSNGSFDSTFDTDGIVTTKIGINLYAQSVVTQADGKILVAGYANLDGSFQFSLVRYNSNGSLDASFGTDGIVMTKVGFNSYGQSLTVQSDGKILVTGNVSNVSSGMGSNEIGLIRYNNNGTLDTTFDNDGIVTTKVGAGSYGQSILVQSDGKILVTGSNYSNDSFALIRYYNNGSLDLNFNSVNTLTNAVFSTESNKTIVIAPEVDVVDDELYTKGNYDNAHLSLQRHGTVNSNDIFSVSSPISFDNGVISYLGTSIGAIIQSNGKLDLTFNSNAIPLAVTSTLRSLTYTNIGNGEPEQITLDWTFSDGNTGNQGTGGAGIVTGNSIVNITDLTPPSINYFSPIQGAKNVALNSDIVLSFNESIQRGYGNIILKNSIGTIISNYDAASSSNLSFTGNTLTINPSSDFTFSTRYIIEFGYGSVNDISGNAFGGVSSYEFTTAVPNNSPTGNVTISGTATQNQTLTASNTLADSDGLGTISYQWFSDDKVISNATQTTYTLTQSDVGKKITVKASYTDNAGTAESIISATTAAVTNINDAPTGSVKIDGQTKQNQVLAISNTLVDTDGLGTITYQWQSNNKDIANATQVTYKLTQTDVGNVITVNANYTDAQGTKESVTSSATAKIENVNDSPTGNVSISGLAAQGQTLASVSTLADIDGMGALKYQWLVNGTAISDATKSTYVLAAADIGKTVSVKVSYTDLLGTAESATSQSTTAIVSTKPSKGNDLLTGKATNDTLSALAGDDTLIGGLGTDKLKGGLGADTFKFTSVNDSGITPKTRDTITDFKSTQNDKIDLSGIDANSVVVGDQAFTFINNAAFSADATGQLRFDSKTGILYGSTNADTNVEFSIVLSGVKSLVMGDFIL